MLWVYDSRSNQLQFEVITVRFFAAERSDHCLVGGSKGMGNGCGIACCGEERWEAGVCPNLQELRARLMGTLGYSVGGGDPQGARSEEQEAGASRMGLVTEARGQVDEWDLLGIEGDNAQLWMSRSG